MSVDEDIVAVADFLDGLEKTNEVELWDSTVEEYFTHIVHTQ